MILPAVRLPIASLNARLIEISFLNFSFLFLLFLFHRSMDHTEFSFLSRVHNICCYFYHAPYITSKCIHSHSFTFLRESISTIRARLLASLNINCCTSNKQQERKKNVYSIFIFIFISDLNVICRFSVRFLMSLSLSLLLVFCAVVMWSCI